MSSITKIKVADTTYDIKDNISGYITKDVDNLTNYYDKEQVDFNIEQVSEDIPTRTSQLTNDSGFVGTAALVGKQDTLISGSNIKTINGANILGSGNLVVESQGEINLVDDVRMNGVSILDNKVADFYISDHYSSTNSIITNYELQNAIDAVEAEITAQGRLIPTKISDLINDSNFISSSALGNYALLSETANAMTMEVNTDYVLTSKLKDKNGSVIDTATVDLPIEGLVMNGRYDTATKKIILTLKNGNTIEFSIADLISDRQPLIDSTHKLDSDLINTTGQTNQFVLASDKTNWNGKQDGLVSGVNIKTINNISLLGAGNINIQGGSGTSDYLRLENKPQINGIELNGNKSLNDLGINNFISGKLDTSKVKNANSTTAGDVYDVTYINTMLGNIETLLGGI